MSTRKAMVKFLPSEKNFIKVGHSAYVHPVNHTSPLVSNKRFVFTSEVLEIFKDGSFETRNSFYQPVEGE